MDIQDSLGPNFVNIEELLTCKTKIVPQLYLKRIQTCENYLNARNFLNTNYMYFAQFAQIAEN